MKLKIITPVFVMAILLLSCKEGAKKEPAPVDVQELTSNQPETHGTELKEADISLTTPLDAAQVSAGKATYELKCQSCHRLTAEKLVGPGWLDVTKRREPLWIMNMITNVDMMLEKDAEAQKLLEQCMVRMPNQNINKDQAREVLEFMRSNDGVK
jgi:mono/diheme cytochrome c family protein